VATIQPDPGRSLADGVVVETRLVARLLGIKLLRVDGVVLLSPGRVGEPRPPGPVPTSSREQRTADGVRPGERLALAGRLIASTGDRLELSRR
jgi:hypothetical protein